jgi:allatostatin A receptor
MRLSPQTAQPNQNLFKFRQFSFSFLYHSQVVAFSICWAPIQIILVLKSLKLYQTTTVTVSIQIISHVLAYLNSCLNPFLYAFLSENFRKAFRKVMWCGPASSQYILAAPDTKSTRTGTRHGNGAASVDIL